jgi:peptide deformylase
VLREKAKRVRAVGPSMQRLIGDMIETMHDSHGVGLAANQVGVLQRVIVIQLPDDEEPRVFINPELVRQEGEREVLEGCLSIPRYRGLVKRSVKVKAKGLDAKGRQVRVSAEGLLAQALEHEVDHLNGTLYIDRLVDRDKLWREEDLEAQEELQDESQDEEPQEEPVESGYTG